MSVNLSQIEAPRKLEQTRLESYQSLRKMQLEGVPPETLEKAFIAYFDAQKAALDSGRAAIKPLINVKNNS